MDSKWSKNGPKIVLKSLKMVQDRKNSPKKPKNDPKMVSKGSKKGQKMVQERINSSKMAPKSS